jgi:hypothetical protein
MEFSESETDNLYSQIQKLKSEKDALKNTNSQLKNKLSSREAIVNETVQTPDRAADRGRDKRRAADRSPALQRSKSDAARSNRKTRYEDDELSSVSGASTAKSYNSENSLQVCYDFMNKGTCQRGSKCSFSHDKKIIAASRLRTERKAQEKRSAFGKNNKY